MTVKLLLDRKREGDELMPSEIHELVREYTAGNVPDYQMAAFAMAVCCRGMTSAETLALTEAMRDSGTCLEWPMEEYPPTADKHSTGGVGDKISLVAQPLAAACGLAVPSLTGRGLGLTGGTADKMESIPGYVAALPLSGYRRIVRDCGCTLTVQTSEIAPADKKLYGLRDVTGTVPSIPLIVASILSKKLAEGVGVLVFDVKCGSGAFMKTRNDAAALARALVDGAKGAGRRACALVTAMDEPLGFAVGNANEVQEAIGVLKGESRAADVAELSVELAARMVSLAKRVKLDEARAECREKLANGEAYRRFARMVKLHGGNLEEFAESLRARVDSLEVKCAEAGYVQSIDARGVAEAAFLLGAGRTRSEETVDVLAGVDLCVVRGDQVDVGTPLACLATATRRGAFDEAARLVREAVVVGPIPPAPRELVLDVF
jgi:pyrimidine-nucleoside phosphorylase